VAIRNYSNTATEATLTSAIASGDTTIALGSFAGFPSAPFTAAIDRGQATEEIVLVTASTPGAVTVTRGYDNTAAQAHAAGGTFLHVVVAKDYAEANAHGAATSGVHGVTGGLVGLTDVQTLTNKALTAPTLANPTVTGTATVAALTATGATSLAALTATGNAAVGGTLTVTGATTLTGALAAGTASFSGLVTASTSPTLGGHLVNKSYADALGAEAATVSTIARRDSAGALTVATPTATGHAATKGYTDAAVTAATTSYFDSGAGSGNVLTSATAPTDTSSVTVPAGTYDVWYSCEIGYSVSSAPRAFHAHLYGGASELSSTSDMVEVAGGSGNLTTLNGFDRITVGATTALTVRTSASATGGTQFAGANKILARKV